MSVLKNITSATFIPALIICTVIAACSSSADKDEQKKIDRIENVLNESIKFHDEVMPLMSEMGSLRLQILQQVDSTGADTSGTAQKLEVAHSLKTWSDAMMDWMKNFSKPPRIEEMQDSKPGELDSILSIQKDQLDDITRINQEMKQAVENGRQFVLQK